MSNEAQNVELNYFNSNQILTAMIHKSDSFYFISLTFDLFQFELIIYNT